MYSAYFLTMANTLFTDFFEMLVIMSAGWCYNSNFEQSASDLLDELYDVDQDKAHEVLTRRLDTWDNCTPLELADKARLMDFMKHHSCQTKLDTIWYGRLATDTRMWQVRLNTEPLMFLELYLLTCLMCPLGH